MTLRDEFWFFVSIVVFSVFLYSLEPVRPTREQLANIEYLDDIIDLMSERMIFVELPTREAWEGSGLRISRLASVDSELILSLEFDLVHAAVKSTMLCHPDTTCNFFRIVVHALFTPYLRDAGRAPLTVYAGGEFRGCIPRMPPETGFYPRDPATHNCTALTGLPQLPNVPIFIDYWAIHDAITRSVMELLAPMGEFAAWEDEKLNLA